MALDAWLEPATAAELAVKVADLDAHPEAVGWLPGSEEAQAELSAVVGAAEPTIAACGRAVVDDLCLLLPASGAGGLEGASGAGGLEGASGAGGLEGASGAGGLGGASGAGGLDGEMLVLVAGAVAHPNRWRLADKLGRPLLGVHEPVPGYAGRLADQVERVLRSLRPERAVERRSWALLDDPTLHQPVATSGVPTRFDPERLWLRVERQALRRLPVTGAVVFAIRTRQWPVAALADHPEQAAGLAASLRSSPDELAAYKGVDVIRPALLDWLDQVTERATPRR